MIWKLLHLDKVIISFWTLCRYKTWSNHIWIREIWGRSTLQFLEYRCLDDTCLYGVCTVFGDKDKHKDIGILRLWQQIHPKAGTSEKNWSIYNHCPLLQNILKQMFAVWEYGRNRQTTVSLETMDRCQRKKRDYVGKIPNLGGGLTQTHSIFFTVFSNSGAYKMA